MILKICVAFFGLAANNAVSASKIAQSTGSLLDNDAVQSDLHLFIYETESSADSPAYKLLQQGLGLGPVNVQVFGAGTQFEGYGSKYSAVYPLLEQVDPDSIAILSDGRDVLINNPSNANDALSLAAVTEFQEAYFELTQSHPGAVVVSAEAQCCVSALTHVVPGGLFNYDGTRNAHACASGDEGCLWNGDDKARPWEAFMTELALTRNESSEYDDVYLNAGLMAGKAQDLLDLIDAIQITNSEDDQAVLTDFMFQNEDKIILDYGQTIFGNNRGGVMGDEQDGCMFGMYGESSAHRLVHDKTGTSPLFVHSPGGFTKCHDELAEQLGLELVTQTARRRLGRELACNYSYCRRMV